MNTAVRIRWYNSHISSLSVTILCVLPLPPIITKTWRLMFATFDTEIISCSVSLVNVFAHNFVHVCSDKFDRMMSRNEKRKYIMEQRITVIFKYIKHKFLVAHYTFSVRTNVCMLVGFRRFLYGATVSVLQHDLFVCSRECVAWCSSSIWRWNKY